MTLHDTDIGAQFVRLLVERIGNERFELWFGTGVSLVQEDATLRVLVASAFAHGSLQKHFRGELLSIAQAVCGPEAQIAIEQSSAALGARLCDLLVPLDAVSVAPSPVSPARPKAISSDPVVTAPALISESSSGEGEPDAASPRPSRYSFEGFVAGPCNQLALNCVQQVLLRPTGPSPVLLYGPPGVGKSHLLEALASAARAQRRRSVLRLSAEEFTTQFVAALKGTGLPNFRRKYRHVDLLIVDEIQFFAGKKATLVEFQHSLDTLLRGGKQVVLAADRHPAELAALGSEFAARLTGGLVCPLEPADRATRAQILARLADRQGLHLADDVRESLAEVLSGDARQLAGAIHRLAAQQSVTGKPLTLAAAREALVDLVRPSTRVVRLADVEAAVCAVFGVESSELRSGSKSRPMVQPRMLAMWLARKFTRAGLSEIGQHFGRRSHSTVISAQKNVESWITAGEHIELAGQNCLLSDAVRRIESRLRMA